LKRSYAKSLPMQRRLIKNGELHGKAVRNLHKKSFYNYEKYLTLQTRLFERKPK